MTMDWMAVQFRIAIIRKGNFTYDDYHSVR